MTRILEDQIAVITGGGQGLGQALSWRLAHEGCHVLVADLNEQGAVETAEAIVKNETDTGRRALALKVDVTNEDQVRDMIDRAIAEFGRIDLVVSNAGLLLSGETDQVPLERWQAVINVNLTGYFLTAKHAIRVMQEQKKGAIVQINSKSGKKGSSKNAAYAASKFGGIGLTQSLALEFAEMGIRINSVCPGNLLDSPLWVNSLYKQYAKNQGITEEQVRQRYIDQVPMKRGCTYDDVANVVVFLASDQSSYMTGQAINVTGGQEMR